MPTIAFSFGRCQAEKIICEIYFALRYFLRGGFRGSVRVQLKYINKKSRPAAASLLLFCLAPKGMVETKRIELSTLRMRTVRSPSWAIGPNQQFQKRNRRIKQYEIIIDVAENRTLCAPSWATSPNRPFFNQKSYEKQIFEIFGFEEKSRKTRLVNGKRTSAAGCSFIWLQTQRPPRWTMSPSSLSCNGR